MALELVTYADLAKLLKLEDALITDYPALDVINATMIPAFEEYLGRQLNNKERTVTQFVNGFKTRFITLEAIPITAMTSVTISQMGQDESLTENEHYEVTEYGIRLWTAVRNVKIVTVYTGGLSAVSEEPRLNRAALYQVSFEFQNKAWIGSESVQAEGGSVTKPGLKLLGETKRMIGKSMHPHYTGKP